MGISMEDVLRNIAAMGEASRQVAVTVDDIRRWGGLIETPEESRPRIPYAPEAGSRGEDKARPR